jgi:Pyruvate/2-oxoacid:ferredoxin oxidoreductase gamma subunit
VSENVPKKAVEVNLKAFDLGKKAAHEMLCNIVKCRE